MLSSSRYPQRQAKQSPKLNLQKKQHFQAMITQVSPRSSLHNIQKRPKGFCCNSLASSTTIKKAKKGSTDSSSPEKTQDIPLPSPGDLVGDEMEPERYLIKEVMGKGAFGSVFNAWDQVRNEEVALKFVLNSGSRGYMAKNEIKILDILNAADPNGDFNTQRIKRNHAGGTACWFVYKEAYVCIVTELLSDSLYSLLEKTSFYGVSLRLIRKFARQILRALCFYSSPDVCVVHCDLKPENILMCNPKKPDVKIIDFGAAVCAGGVLHKYAQSRFYRAPEVILRLAYSHPVDMWSLACILFELHVGTPLFQGRNEGEQIAEFVSYLGMPPDYMIVQSPVSSKYFSSLTDKFNRYSFELAPEIQSKFSSKNLSDALGVDTGGPDGRRALEPGHTRNDYLCFLDLLERMLVYDPAERITPQQALKHSFFTGVRL